MDMIAIQILVLVFSVVFHETAHGWTAWKLGDSTARDAGRVTLNPLPHIDPIGSILVPVVLAATGAPLLYGWAKPVPVRVDLLNDPKNDNAKVAAAGPLSNLLLALISALALGLVALVANTMLSQEMLARQNSSSPLYFLVNLFKTGIMLNVVLALFNLVPLPPLDGSWVLSRFLPDDLRHRYNGLRRFGFLPVIGFLVLVQYTFLGQFVMKFVHSIWSFYLGIANSLAGLLG